MATNKNLRFKTSRRFGMNIYGHPKALKRQPAETRQKKMSEYGLQLAEKQKVKALYNLLERQFYRYYDKARRMSGVVGENLLSLLETRLDNLVYRAGFARSIRQARQMVSHGLIAVDGKKVDIPSYPVRPGQVITLKEAYRTNEMFKQAFLELKSFDLPYVEKSFDKLVRDTRPTHRCVKNSPTKMKSTKRSSSNCTQNNFYLKIRPFSVGFFISRFNNPLPLHYNIRKRNIMEEIMNTIIFVLLYIKKRAACRL